jgi:hypothetical protein
MSSSRSSKPRIARTVARNAGRHQRRGCGSSRALPRGHSRLQARSCRVPRPSEAMCAQKDRPHLAASSSVVKGGSVRRRRERLRGIGACVTRSGRLVPRSRLPRSTAKSQLRTRSRFSDFVAFCRSAVRSRQAGQPGTTGKFGGGAGSPIRTISWLQLPRPDLSDRESCWRAVAPPERPTRRGARRRRSARRVTRGRGRLCRSGRNRRRFLRLLNEGVARNASMVGGRITAEQMERSEAQTFLMRGERVAPAGLPSPRNRVGWASRAAVARAGRSGALVSAFKRSTRARFQP